MPQQKITQFTVSKRKSEGERTSPRAAKVAKVDGQSSVSPVKGASARSPKASPAKSSKAATTPTKSPKKSAEKTPKKSPKKASGESQAPDTPSASTAAAEPAVETPSTPVSLLSEDQRKTIEQNRCAAKMKLLSKSLGNVLNGLDSSWFQILEPEFSKPYFLKLAGFVNDQRGANPNKIYPPEDQVFSWSRHTPFDKVRVVLIGQDPYHGPRQAHGLCFSVLRPEKPPPSLLNMYKELETDVNGFKRPTHGDLTEWADQGVLLLNSVLTVRASEPNSHKDKGWEQFTDAVIRAVNEKRRNVVFILWGGYAQKKGRIVDKQKHCVLQGPHPSPLSAHNGFFGCKHFSKTNDYLKQHNFPAIDWNKLP